MLHGSFVRGDYTPGRSDVDAVLTFPCDVVIPKEFMHEVSLVLCYALRNNNVPFQVSPLDTTTARDGRFNSFTGNFYEYFLSEGKVVVGPDYRKEMVCQDKKTGEESVLSHNLRKARVALLLAEHHKQQEMYEKFLDGFNSALNAASRGASQILYMTDGQLRTARFSALEELSRNFPSLNTEPLLQIKELYSDLTKLDMVYRKPSEVTKVWNSTVTFLEEMMREYIRKFPRQVMMQ